MSAAGGASPCAGCGHSAPSHNLRGRACKRRCGCRFWRGPWVVVIPVVISPRYGDWTRRAPDSLLVREHVPSERARYEALYAERWGVRP